jgi:hypothetical protein
MSGNIAEVYKYLKVFCKSEQVCKRVEVFTSAHKSLQIVSSEEYLKQSCFSVIEANGK